ncbi:MAG: amidase [Dethiobacter sp.]|jgi:amidase|nr:amidase [Dethiobacter sp.]
MSPGSELISLTACEAVELLRRREVSPLDLIEAAAARIKDTDGIVNALPTLCIDRAREKARKIMDSSEKKENPGWLAGLPVAVKDLNDVAGVRTTYGSPIFKDYVPERSDIMVETLENNGAVVLAKSNTPEFGAGANTFNEVFGKTHNPWDIKKTCGGSSGGSAVALAAGQVWLATGSDLGGSLRIPASFCSVVGLRPSPGRVAFGPGVLPFSNLAVVGPMARNVRDVALMLDAMSGPNPYDPLSLKVQPGSFLQAANNPQAPQRIAFSRDLGLGPVDKEVADICQNAVARISKLCGKIDETAPDFSNGREVFQVLRAAAFAAKFGPLLKQYRDKLKPEVIWNIEEGLTQDAGKTGWAERERGALFHRMAEFFESYDLLVCPAVITPPFDIDMRYLSNLNGHEFKTYIDWLIINSAITLTSSPAVSIPCGFTREGLPVGLQIIGKPYGEESLLSAAALFEDMLGISRMVPVNPREK